MKSPHTRTRSRGLTLVELMVGLAIGLFIAAIATTVFVNSRALFTVSSSQSRMGENARLAMDLIKGDLRQAGFMGCHPSPAPSNPPIPSIVPVSTLNNAKGSFLTTGANDSNGNPTPPNILGYAATSTTAWTPTLPSFLSAPNAGPSGTSSAPTGGSDIISILVPVDNMALGLTQAMAATTSDPQITAGLNAQYNTLAQGDIVLITNCNHSALFQLTAADPVGTGVLSHTVGAGITGSVNNSTNDLGWKFQPDDSTIYRVQTHHYYVAPSVMHPGTNSLWLYTVPSVGADYPVEVAAGIDKLVITYGVDTDGDRTANEYLTADAVPAASWSSVVSVRIEIDASTTQSNTSKSSASGRLTSKLVEVVALRNIAS